MFQFSVWCKIRASYCNKAKNFGQIFFDFWVGGMPSLKKMKKNLMMGGSEAKSFWLVF